MSRHKNKPQVPEQTKSSGKSAKPDLQADGAKVRLDKWLWSARFYKTRTLATEEVDGGKVKCNGERVKPAYGVQVGDRLTVPRGWDDMEVIVTGLAEKRGSATLAEGLYEETPESKTKREQRAANRAAIKDPARDIKARPTKRDRRALDDFRSD